MPLFQKGNYVIMSGATPGQGGYHHVNEQPREYWIDKFAEYGFTYDPITVQEIIDVSKNKQFMSKNMLFFTNNNPHTITEYKKPFNVENLETMLHHNISQFVARGGSV
jgi:hypothetical protein